MSPNASNPPTDPIPCPHLPSADWKSPLEAFQALSADGESAMSQSWQARFSPGFKPARVRTGWNDSGLMVASELEDADIFNTASKPGDPAWRLGDVFEIFLKQAGRTCYHEFHITPFNHRTVLRFPSLFKKLKEAAKPARLDPLSFALAPDSFRSSALVDAGTGRWWVLAQIPWPLLLEERASKPAFLSFSFSRYDYTRGGEEPVCSSTSPHTRLDFHEQAAWRVLEFKR